MGDGLPGLRLCGGGGRDRQEAGQDQCEGKTEIACRKGTTKWGLSGRLSGGGATADIPLVMSGASSREHDWRIGGRRLAATALVVCLLLTVVAWQVVARQVQRAEAGLFQQRTDRVLTTMRARFASAKQAVYGARALLEASQGITPDDWARYVGSVEPFLNEGVVGLGRVERIARDGHRGARAAGPGRRGARPSASSASGQNPWLYVVTGIEPAARNRGALGLDVGIGHHPPAGRRARDGHRARPRCRAGSG